MKWHHIILPLVLLSCLLTACGSDGLYRFTLVTEGQHVFSRDLAGDLILLGGSVDLPAGFVLDGSAHILSGRLIVAGQITGDVSFMGGDLTIDPTAQIGGDLSLGGESHHLSPAAIIGGKINTGTGVQLPNLPEQTAPSFWILLVRTLVSGSLLGLAAVFLVRKSPRGVQRVRDAEVHHSLVSGAMGLLVGVVGISLLVTMAYTILLIPVSLLGLCLLGASVLYGWVCLGISVGQLGFRIVKRPAHPSTAAFFGTLVFMLGLEGLSSIPFIGGLIGISMASIGLGAVSLTRFGFRRFVPDSADHET